MSFVCFAILYYVSPKNKKKNEETLHTNQMQRILEIIHETNDMQKQREIV